KDNIRSFSADKAAIGTFLKKPKSWLTIVFILLFNVATGIYALLPTIFAKLADMKVADIMVYAAAAYGAAMVGVLIAGKISDIIGAKKLVVPVLIFFWAAVCLMFFVKPNMSVAMIWVIMIVFGLAMGASFVPTGRLSMEIANPEISGFVYAGMSSVSNIAQGAVAGLVFALFSTFMPLPYSIFPLMVFSIASCFLINKLDWWEPHKNEKPTDTNVTE
ncbi:MAG: MFS transporter, partial [Clostridia bacterium]